MEKEIMDSRARAIARAKGKGKEGELKTGIELDFETPASSEEMHLSHGIGSGGTDPKPGSGIASGGAGGSESSGLMVDESVTIKGGVIVERGEKRGREKHSVSRLQMLKPEVEFLQKVNAYDPRVVLRKHRANPKPGPGILGHMISKRFLELIDPHPAVEKDDPELVKINKKYEQSHRGGGGSGSGE
jgi:hypothetical protein